MTPNLFSYATSELSQDAFIAWLASWASPHLKETNPQLHLAATDFVKTLIEKSEIPICTVNDIKVKRQKDKIDVWIEVNDEHLIIIEDKVDTDQHSNQLQRYREIGKTWCATRKAQLTCIYLKTHSETDDNLAIVKSEGYIPFLRKDFLTILKRYKTCNNIYNDFQSHLQQIDDSESSFKAIHPDKWNDASWKGFYQILEKLGSIESWSKVNNPSGGFLNAIVGGFSSCNDKPVHIQIEQGDLCIKIGEVYDNEERKLVRDDTHSLLINLQHPSLPINRPSSFGSGVYMTVANVPADEWMIIESGIVNVEKTCLKLECYKNWLINVLTNRYVFPLQTPEQIQQFLATSDRTSSTAPASPLSPNPT